MKQSIKSRLKRAAMYLLGFSATPMLTACYGMPYREDDVDPTPFKDICGTVYDHDTQAPIAGIQVSVPSHDLITTTDADGKFAFDQYFVSSVRVVFEDIDGKNNGDYYGHAHIVTSRNHLDINSVMREK